MLCRVPHVDLLPCARCGYDLRAQPTDGVCPECGATVAEAIARRAAAAVPVERAARKRICLAIGGASLALLSMALGGATALESGWLSLKWLDAIVWTSLAAGAVAPLFFLAPLPGERPWQPMACAVAWLFALGGYLVLHAIDLADRTSSAIGPRRLYWGGLLLIVATFNGVVWLRVQTLAHRLGLRGLAAVALVLLIATTAALLEGWLATWRNASIASGNFMPLQWGVRAVALVRGAEAFDATAAFQSYLRRGGLLTVLATPAVAVAPAWFVIAASRRLARPRDIGDDRDCCTA